MKINRLCSKFAMEESFTEEILNYDKSVNYEEIADTLDLLFDCSSWDDALAKLREYVGADERGVKIVTLYMHCLLTTYDKYQQKGIPKTIFWDTVAFIPRFVKEHQEKHGYSAFTWAFWFPRQIAMCEFRIGEYEYELLEEDSPAFMDWIYPSSDLPYEQLPEQTTLQRKVKEYLLSGKKVGWAYGKYIQHN